MVMYLETPQVAVPHNNAARNGKKNENTRFMKFGVYDSLSKFLFVKTQNTIPNMIDTKIIV